MYKRQPINQEMKEQIYQSKLNGQTYKEIAANIGYSIWVVRKWWRVGRDYGLSKLGEPRRGRAESGILAQFDPKVASKAELMKRFHPTWGANRVLIELRYDLELAGLALPGRSRLSTFFKQVCPDCVAKREPRISDPKGKSRATAVHEEWGMDCQEGIRLSNGEIANICNIHDPFGGAPIASKVFSVKTEKRWRKLEVKEYREVLRDAFQEWKTLPDSVRTDNELRLVGQPASDFPGMLTLYLAGLGIKHNFIRPGTPTDQPQLERGHRTLDNLAFNEQSLSSLDALQQALDHERQIYLQDFPSQASNCNGRPPLKAHPSLLRPRRNYSRETELSLFSLQRVYEFLATFTFKRKVSAYGCISLGRQQSFGRGLFRQLKNKSVIVKCDPSKGEWGVYQKATDPDKPLIELARRPIKFLSIQGLTGLDPDEKQIHEPIQLTLPFLAA